MANIVDPEWAFKTSSLLVPTSTSSVAPLPTVIPTNVPHWEKVGETGIKTLWVS
jgi:hypothetical protein